MGKKKFIFNDSTLKFEEYRASVGRRIWRFLIFLLTAGIFGFLFFVLVEAFFGSPKERMLEKENAYLRFQYDILNDKLDEMDVVLTDMRERDDNIYRVMFESEPVPREEIMNIMRTGKRLAMSGYASTARVEAISDRVDKISKMMLIQSKSFDTIVRLIMNKSEMLSSIPAIMPVRGTDIMRLSSGFGRRTDPIYKVMKFHAGLDFSGPIGTPIYVTGDGVVEKLVKSDVGYGNHVIVDHGFGYKTRYAHISKAEVKVGEKVRRGQEIALMGNSGKSTAPHLHYEVIKNGRPVNPIHFFLNDITPEEYEEILKLSQMPSQTMD